MKKTFIEWIQLYSNKEYPGFIQNYNPKTKTLKLYYLNI